MATVTVFGGTGFLGRAVVRAVSAAGFEPRIAARHAPPGGARVEHVTADVTDAASVGRAVEGAAAVVNAVSLYVEKGGATFHAVHVEGAERVALAAREAGAAVLVHVSGLGTHADSPSAFVRARAQGEQAVRRAFESTVLVKPSVMFGRDDSFLSSLELATRFPVVPLFGRGESRLQPAFVEDVAGAVAKVVADPAARRPAFELGGAEILTYRRALEAVMAHLGRSRLLVPVPFALWKALTIPLGALPSPPLTRDQVVLLEHDNVVGPGAPAFRDLGIEATAFTSGLAECLPVRR